MAKTRQKDWVWIARGLSQFGFAAYILIAAARNATSAVETGSTHSLCPFGAVESLWSLVVAGKYLPKIHASSVVLSVGLLVGALIVGGALCGEHMPLEY